MCVVCVWALCEPCELTLFCVGKHVKSYDVHNLLYKERRKGIHGAVDDRVDRRLQQFADEEVGNIARVFKDLNGYASCITIQTAAMRRLYSVFPQVIMIDATHGTNNANYKLFSFMVQDGFGHGQFAQHALLMSETKVTTLIRLVFLFLMILL
jgi:hypothetical protein